MDILYPRIKRERLPAMIGISLLGAVLAGLYGAAHDQLSYTISKEYFTKLTPISASIQESSPPKSAFSQAGGLDLSSLGF
jgi:hypothetical protein